MATETLRPNAAGDETNLYRKPDTGEANWENVDEVIPDELTTHNWSGTADVNWRRDFYNIADHSIGSGVINKITVTARCLPSGVPDQTGLKIAIKSNVTTDEGGEVTVTFGSWENCTQEWALNPDDAAAWEWADIDALQIGINMRRSHTTEAYFTSCTQIYVEVDYVEAFERSLSVAIGLAPTLTRAVTYERSLSSTIGLSSSLTRVVTYARALSVAIGLGATLSSIRGFVESLSVAIGLSASLSRAVTFERALSTKIGLSASLSRVVAFGRALLTAIGLAPSLTRVVAYGRSFSVAIGLATILSRVVTYGRSLSTAIGLVVSLSRQCNFGRSLSTAIGLIVRLRWTIKMKRRLASIGTNRTIGTVGDNREVSTTGENRDVEDF